MTEAKPTPNMLVMGIVMAYLLTVAGFYFDGWYHAIVGRDQFWIAPHFFVMAGQIVHTILAFLLARQPMEHADERRILWRYLGLQLIFFFGLAFDESWHRVIGEETIDTPLVFWGPPHFVIALSLLLSPFLLHTIIARIIRSEVEGVIARVLIFGALFAFIQFYFQPLWPLGPFRVLGAYGEIGMMALLGFVLFRAHHAIRGTLYGASIVTLVGLSLMEIMSWGRLADVPQISSVFGTVTAYPYWLFFFSFLIAAIVLDVCVALKKHMTQTLAAVWGGVQALFYYTGAKLWVDYSPASFYPGWRGFPGLPTSWGEVLLYAILGALGAAIGYSIVESGMWSYLGGGRREKRTDS